MSSSKNKIFKFIGLVLLSLSIAFSAGYGGYYYGIHKTKIEFEKKFNLAENNPLKESDFSLFWEAVQKIKENYVKINEISDQDLLYGSISGLVGALKDSYSSFFKPSDAKKFEEDIKGVFGGIGAEIGLKNNQLIIVAPLKGNPAEKAGLKPGDKILKIDDTDTLGLTLDEAVKLIRGQEGTVVRLLILRDGWEEAKEFKITRATIIVPTLDWKIIEDNILYIQLYSFNANAERLFYEAVLNGLLQGAKGIILDLRNNPGGFLDVAVRLAGWFLDRGDVVVREKFSDENERSFFATGNAALKDFPVVILVNKGSASASEILAGALRDNRNVKLVGEKTFGKGTVQELENLKDGSVIKISIAEWLTPKGNAIEKNGLEPDFVVENPKENNKDNENEDFQLKKAIEVLKSEMK